MAAALAELTRIVRGVLESPDIELTVGSRFEDLAGWDSMHLIALVVEIECRFGLHFAVEEIEPLLTVGDLLCVTARKRALASA